MRVENEMSSKGAPRRGIMRAGGLTAAAVMATSTLLGGAGTALAKAVPYQRTRYGLWNVQWRRQVRAHDCVVQRLLNVC
ncbi:hypothetical protein GCM10009753_31480 [Streptantibioticus ferralitis]